MGIFARSGRLRALARSETGATAIDYALILALIAIALVGVLSQLGLSIDAMFDEPVAAFQGQSQT